MTTCPITHPSLSPRQTTGVNTALCKLLLAGLGMLLCASVSAQQMFRCGSTYQDRPCEGKDSKVVVGISNNTAQAVGTKTSADVQCARLGVDAQKIKWAREGGRTEEIALAAARTASEKQLIEDVYARSGTSSEVRSGVEADCMAEKERERNAANWQRKDKRGALPASSSTSAESASEPTEKQSSAKGSTADSTKKTRCDNITAAMEMVRKNQRSGGDSATMEDLRQQQRDADKMMRDAGC